MFNDFFVKKKTADWAASEGKKVVDIFKNERSSFLFVLKKMPAKSVENLLAADKNPPER